MSEEGEETREVGGYRLLRRLGSGGMGTVHEAVDGEGNRVALKLLHPHIATDPQARKRLAREVSLLNRVKEAGVARVLDAEVEDSEAFVVTELVDGPTLEDDVADDGAFGLDELAGLARGLATSLTAIHSAGIVHRDLKPGNVMLSSDGPVLIDFGIAQVADDVRLTQTGLVTGTPGYLDPGVIAGGDPGPAGDWWAWAAVLLFAATGRPPFGRGSMEAVLARVATGRADTAGLPSSIAQVLRAALDPDPTRRPEPAGVLGVLDAAADDPAAAGPPEGQGSPDAAAMATAPMAAGPPPVIPPASAPRAEGAWGQGLPGEPGAGSSPSDAGATTPLESGGPSTKVMPVASPEPPGHDWHEGAAGWGEPRPQPWQAGLPAQAWPEPIQPPPPSGLTAEGQLPGQLPAWTRPARRRSGVVLAVGVGVSAASPVFPGVFLLVTGGLLLLTATAGWAGRSRRASRLRHGLRRGDDARMLAGVPWHLLRGLASLLPGIILGTAMAAALWWFGGETSFDLEPERHEPLLLWVAGLALVLVTWLTPTSVAAREGARACLDVLTPGPGFRALLAVVFLGYAVVVAVQILLGAAPGATWTPLPITLER